jgi:hypothetical protein
MKPATDQRKARVHPKHNKLFYKNRWLLSQHLVIALRRAGVVCDIVVADPSGNVESLPTGDLSRRQRLALRCSDSEVDLGPIETDTGRSPSKFCH